VLFPRLARLGALDGDALEADALALPCRLLEAGDPKDAPTLITRAKPAAVVPVGVLGKDHEVSKVRVARIAGIAPVTGALSTRVREKEAPEAHCELMRRIPKAELPSRTRRILDCERVAVEMVIALERFDQEVVDREPDRTPPIGVATEESRVALARDIVYAPLMAVYIKAVGVVPVDARKRTDAVGCQELSLVKEIPQYLLQSLSRGNGE
jgi:hypothetical protein